MPNNQLEATGLKEELKEPPLYRVVMTYGPEHPCNLLMHSVLHAAYNLDAMLIERAVREARDGRSPSIYTGSRDVCETRAARGNSVFNRIKPHYCFGDCRADFTSEPA